MDFFTCDVAAPSVSVHVSRFQGSGGVEEYHLVIRPGEYGSFQTQLEQVCRAYGQALDELSLKRDTAILRRFFCSDLVNQADALRAMPLSDPGCGDELCAVSWVGQSPTGETKVMLWAYHVSDPAGPLKKSQQGTHLVVDRSELSHHWSTGLVCPSGAPAAEQTWSVFGSYDDLLRAKGMSLADHAVRTWLFVRDIDVHYPGMVAARREFFAENGLTPDTHFIASSGIEAVPAEIGACVTMDAYAIAGLRPEQVRYLSAPDHLSPTHIYGVTFERGTAIAYRDRTHVVLSGTASIDSRGNIVHPGDVSRQLDRTLENAEAVLAQAGATLRDMAVFVVYVRDPADHALATTRMRERFGDAPIAVVVAPVCRPGWLIEIEGVAMMAASEPASPLF
jgi:enamine deaminase RidA (YjgF/YER057c/UK114 family)